MKFWIPLIFAASRRLSVISALFRNSSALFWLMYSMPPISAARWIMCVMLFVALIVSDAERRSVVVKWSRSFSVLCAGYLRSRPFTQ